MIELIYWVFNILRYPLYIQGFKTSVFNIIIYLLVFSIVVSAINKLTSTD